MNFCDTPTKKFPNLPKVSKDAGYFAQLTLENGSFSFKSSYFTCWAFSLKKKNFPVSFEAKGTYVESNGVITLNECELVTSISESYDGMNHYGKINKQTSKFGVWQYKKTITNGFVSLSIQTCPFKNSHEIYVEEFYEN